MGGRRGRRERLDDAEGHAGSGDGGDFGEPGTLVVRELIALAGLGAEDAGEMAGVVTGELGVIVVDAVDEEAAAGQKIW